MSTGVFLTAEPGKTNARLCLGGVRITVEDVLSYLSTGMTRETLLAEFPYLTEGEARFRQGHAASQRNSGAPRGLTHGEGSNFRAPGWHYGAIRLSAPADRLP